MIRLVGIVVVILGFILRVNPLLTVLVAGLSTGLVAGMGFDGVVAEFGRLFVDSRAVTLVVIVFLPVIGLLERYGLRERAQRLIRRSGARSAGGIILTYTAVRELAISVGVGLGGHASAVRPLVVPMAEAAAEEAHGPLSEEGRDQIRAHAAAGENVGNFFGEDLFIAVGAVLLMSSFFDTQHMSVGVWSMALWGIPTGFVALGAMAWRTRLLDRRIARLGAKKTQ